MPSLAVTIEHHALKCTSRVVLTDCAGHCRHLSQDEWYAMQSIFTYVQDPSSFILQMLLITTEKTTVPDQLPGKDHDWPIDPW
jgi:hypothetical protein